MLALGVDPGTRHLGWGFVRREGARLRHIAHGILHLDPSEPLALRLLDIDQRLDALLLEYRPDVASVETLFFHKDAQAAAKLGHARGVVLAALARRRVNVFEYAPAHVKRTIAGTGQAKKPQVAAMVRVLLALPDLPPADAADALALALTHLRIGELGRSVALLPHVSVGARAGKGRGRAVLRALARAQLAK
ncbi:MAG: crossover junction endodeoxyribonuclease RuvC [Polyangiaceae bacterium]|nr:crossover junction endodeoxyribonuclease RuvC [Polyangiaceae bacterium]